MFVLSVFWIGSFSLLPRIYFLSIGVLGKSRLIAALVHPIQNWKFSEPMPCFYTDNMFAYAWTEATLSIPPYRSHRVIEPATGNNTHADRQNSSTALLRRH